MIISSRGNVLQADFTFSRFVKGNKINTKIVHTIILKDAFYLKIDTHTISKVGRCLYLSRDQGTVASVLPILVQKQHVCSHQRIWDMED